MKYILVFFLAALTFCACTTGKSVSKMEAGNIEQALNERQFTFVAERASPIRGRTRYLTSSYDVRVTPDSLISFLPYFGRSYTAPIDPSQVFTQFTSTDFAYESKPAKSKQWNISLRPRDAGDIQELSFTIFDNATATLTVLSVSHSPINYQGYIIHNEPANR